MTFGFASATSSDSSSSVKNTCWITVAIIVGVLIFIFIINDLFIKKQYKCKKTQKNVKFYDEDNEDNEQYEQVNTVRKSSCSLNN
jgi:uncharacterized membrane protein YciS (DUF1049 family)